MADPAGEADGGALRLDFFRPASDAPVPRLGDHLRWRIAGVSRLRRPRCVFRHRCAGVRLPNVGKAINSEPAGNSGSFSECVINTSRGPPSR
jgi:hypothetical protein